MNVHQLFISGALIVGALSAPAFAAAAGPTATTTGAPDAAPVAGAAGSASETDAEPADTARAVAALAAAPTCASWTDGSRFTEPPPRRYRVHIPSTTRNGNQPDCVLGLRNQGPGVFILQDALIKCYGQGISQDAIYGPKTKEAVGNVQNFHRVVGNLPDLVVDGVYGPDTRAVMEFAKYQLNGGPFFRCW